MGGVTGVTHCFFYETKAAQLYIRCSERRAKYSLIIKAKKIRICEPIYTIFQIKRYRTIAYIVEHPKRLKMGFILKTFICLSCSVLIKLNDKNCRVAEVFFETLWPHLVVHECMKRHQSD